MKAFPLLLIVIFCSLNVAALLDSTSRAFIPGYQAAALEDSWSVWQNPAGIAFVRAHELSFSYLYKNLNQNKANHLTANGLIGMTEKFSLGLGFNAFNDVFFKNKSKLKSKFSSVASFGFKAHEKFGIGLSIFNLLEKNNNFLFSFGLINRPFFWLSLFAYYQEVQNGYFSAPNLYTGFSLRPFDEYLTMGFDAKFKAKDSKWTDGFRFSSQLSFQASFEGMVANLGIETPFITQGNFSPEYSFGLDFDFPHFGFGLLGGFESASKNYAFGGKVRSSTEKWPSMAKLSNYWVQFDQSSRDCKYIK